MSMNKTSQSDNVLLSKLVFIAWFQIKAILIILTHIIKLEDTIAIGVISRGVTIQNFVHDTYCDILNK